MSVNAGDIILASDYNSIRNTLYSLIVSEYGYVSDTLPATVAVGDIITQQQWYNLYTDINRCVIHQTNTLIPGISAPLTGNPVFASFVNALESAVNTAYSNRYNVHPNQLISNTTNAVSTRVAGWNSSVSHSVRYEWTDSSTLVNFFKLGGKIKLALSYPSGSYTAEELVWADLIDTANSVLSLSSGMYLYSDSATTKSFVAADDGTNQITVEYARNPDNRSITVTIDLVVGGPTLNIDLDVTSTMTHYYSTNTVGPSPYGVPAQRPSVQQLVGLDGGGTGGVSPTKILSVSPTSMSFNFYVDTGSGEQPITLTNLGNTLLTVTGILYTTVYGPYFNANPNYTGMGGSSSTTIAPGASKTFLLSYTASSTGNATASIVFFSDNDSGAVSIPITLTSLPTPFSFTLTPSSWSPTVVNDSPVSQKFTIVPANGSYSFYISTLPSYGLFTMNNNTSDGPVITFNTGATANGTYNTTLSVTVNSFLVTVPISVTVNRNLAVTRNIGTWISAYGPKNSVIGFSYDKIDNLKYLTIGIGGGADGVAALSAGGQVSVTNLGINADSKYIKGGPALYKSTSIAGGYNPDWNPFLLNNGVWIRSEDLSTYGFTNHNITRTYYFRVEVPGTYYWNATVDDNAYITIDDVLVADLTSGRRWSSFYSSNIPFSLTGGLHSISFTFDNSQGPSAIAITITNGIGTIIWSTLDPVRAQDPYVGWAEVYRIALTAGARTYYCEDAYCVKDSSAATTTYDTVARKYNEFFGSASLKSLIKVDDDGFGNLSISMGARYAIPSTAGGPDVRNTVDFLGESFYYYSEQRSTYNTTTVGRVTQLESRPSNGLTKYFIGFDSGGTVKTTSVPIPTGLITSITSVFGGGGCPAPWHKILLSSGQLINAGDLKVGMQVRTQHEHTLEWGDHIVTFVQIQQQDRMEILFDHCRFVCSESHKFHIQGPEWKEANEVTVGDVISGHIVKEVNHIEHGDVVKITVNDAHTYICEGMLSHNKTFRIDSTGFFGSTLNSV